MRLVIWNKWSSFELFLCFTQFLAQASICLNYFFNWRLITLQYWGGFCHTFTWISHGYTCVPHPEPPSHLPPHLIPQGHPSAPALSTLSHASNLNWRSISHMIIFMFQCISLKSSHPHLLPQSPKVCDQFLSISFTINLSLYILHINYLLQ